ncbi:TonB-dependent receptor [Paludibacter sp. 221]|uniref:SusC/RagA family TonB-linked outer membrane protein n=1 Tax=Paludibacter sp. 221 TaxID=2302939 RepID=UPI0013D32A6D|nr:TonB-dependent receptor [Paludibacter sp. 221]NDV46080.1 TonB-dependent receptor [Paludibacter sp. 221]
MKHLKLILIFFLFVSIGVHAQSLRVQGTVISAEDQEPLIGANVMVKGSSVGTSTDMDGRYSIEVPQNSVLVFSFIGCKPVEMQAKPTLNVALELDAIMMDEVVSLGYSSQKKTELSSAVVTISAEALTDVTSSDVGNMLQGKVAGVQISNSTGQPGSAAEIRIRGTGSIGAAADPLYVVDGIAGGSFNPNDVETISVLKDAGATAIYGASAAGGVIVVTTKAAKKNQPTRINFKASAGAKQALFGNFQMMDSEELYYFHKSMYSSTLFTAQRPASLLSQDFDWQGAYFDMGVIQNYNLSLSGGNEKVGYYASLDYYNEDGTLINTGYDKISARLNLSAQLASRLNMNVRVNFENSNTDQTSSWMVLNDAYKKMPWDNPYDANGELVYIDSAKRPDTGGAWYSQDKWNSLHGEQYNYAKSHSFGITADVQLNWNITDWLTATSSNRFSESSWKYVQYIDPRSYDASYADGYLYNSIGMSRSWGTTNMLKAAHSFGQHSIGGMVGWEYGHWISEYTAAAGTGMPDGVDALNASTVNSIEGYEIPGASWSTFGQAQYDYAKRYFLTASFRAEASSMFAPGKRVGYFPSVAASWLISNESFLKGNDVLTFLKLRASYGLTGNNNIGNYQYLATYSLNSSYQDKVSASPTRLSNDYLCWETAKMTAVGIDANIGKRIEMSLDVYNTDNTGILLKVPVAPSTGFFEIMENAGSVRNQGIEYRIDATPVKTKDWMWNVGFNIGFNKNRVTYTPDHAPFYQTVNSVIQQVKEGQDIYSWYMKKWMGVDPTNGDPLWEKITYDADGNEIARGTTNNYNEATEQVVGKATPLFSGGLSTGVSYKGIFLNVNANFTYGNKVYNYNRMANDSDGAYLGYNQLSLENNNMGWSRWENPGDEATHPKAVLNGNKLSNSISSRYLEDGSYLRIRNVTVGYNFPAQMLSKAKINHCRVSLTGDNLFTFTKFSGMDPEVSLTKTTYNHAGMYSDNYPVSRSFLLSVEIGF